MRMDAVGIVLSVLLSTIRIILTCFVGVILARLGLFPPSLQKGINDLVAYLVLPCLLFSKVGDVITAGRFLHWWPLPVFCFINVFGGILCGYLVGRVFRLNPKHELPFTMAAIGFGNSNSVPLSIMSRIVYSTPALIVDPNETPEEATKRALAYVLFYAIFMNLLRWSVGFYLLKPKKPSEKSLSIQHPRMSMQEEGVKRKSINGTTPPEDEKQPLLDTLPSPTKWDKAKVVLKNIREVITPPLIAGLLAMFIGMIPPLKGLFFGARAPLSSTITDVLLQIGECTVPLTLLNLGAKLAKGPILNASTETVSKKTYPIIIILKLLFTPLIGTGLIYLLKHFDVYGTQDPILLLVILVEGASPSAINLSILTALIGNLDQEMVNLLFFSYLAAVPTLTGYGILFIYLLLG